MSDPAPSALAPFLARLRVHTLLSDTDLTAFDRMPIRNSTIGGGEQIVRQGSRAAQCYVILSGYAFSYKIASDGGRQITSFVTKGDLIGLEQAMLGVTDHGVRAMSVVHAVGFTSHALTNLVMSRPTIALALIRQTLAETEDLREWMLTAARRPALARVAHLICELAHRESAGQPFDGQSLECRVTQEQLGDALGLTAVHVNRILGTLRALNVIRIDSRLTTIIDVAALRQIGDFRSRNRSLCGPEMSSPATTAHEEQRMAM